MSGYGVQQIAHPFTGRVLVCSNCGKKDYINHKNLPSGLRIAVVGPRHEPFKEWYACSQGCIDAVLQKARNFLVENLEE